MIAFRVQIPDLVELPPLFLRGLEENRLYEIEGEAQPRSGKAWKTDGMLLNLRNMQSCVKRIHRIQ